MKKQKVTLRKEERYANVMGEVKARLFLVDEFIGKKLTTGSDTTDLEFISLQLRKIMELIALASIVPNQGKYKALRADFSKHYHAKRIFGDLRKVNDKFFPTAMMCEPVTQPGVNLQVKARDNVWLTEKRFEREYEKLGAMMHADNPFAQRRSYAQLYKQHKTLIKNIWELLEVHSITIIGSRISWIVLMHEKGKAAQVLGLGKVA